MLLLSFFFIIFILILPHLLFFFFFFNDPAPTEIYPLSLHDALPISLAVALEICALEPGPVLAFKQDLARRRLLEPQDELGGGRLAAAALSHHAQRTAGQIGRAHV